MYLILELLLFVSYFFPKHSFPSFAACFFFLNYTKSNPIKIICLGKIQFLLQSLSI